jgi:phosphoserine aminotransferase
LENLKNDPRQESTWLVKKGKQGTITENLRHKSREYMKIAAVADVIFHDGATYKQVDVITTNLMLPQNAAYVPCKEVFNLNAKKKKFTHNLVLEDGRWRIALI